MYTLTALASTFVAEARGATDLDHQATVRYRRAVAKLPWAQTHRRCVGLLDSAGRVLASADCFDLEAVLHGRPIRCHGLGNVRETPLGASRHATDLVAHVVDNAGASGFHAVLVSSSQPLWPRQDSFTPLTIRDVTLQVTESDRRGAPMVPVRCGERGDLVHLASIRPLGTSDFRLVRTAELLDFAIARRRLLAAVAPAGTRQVHFLVVEEGARAAAYVVVTVTGEGWRLEECGDHDPTGARVGALLQVLVAREPAEHRPRITASLPPGFQPPQVSVTDARVAGTRLWLKLMGSHLAQAAVGQEPIAWWPGDPPDES
jgi:hypothetical protein